MSSLPRVKASPALLPRALVSFGALVAIGWAAFAYGSGAARAGAGFATELLALAVVGALTRRYGIPLPGNGFSSYVLGVVAYALLDRAWAFATLLAPPALLLRAARPRVAASRSRGPRRGCGPPPRDRAHHRDRRQPLRHAPRRARRRAAARVGALPGDRCRHQPGPQLRPHPGAHAPPRALG